MPPQPAPIGLLVKTYPKLSETFILEEILGLERRGLRLCIFSLQRPTDAITHASHARVRAPVGYLPAPRLRGALPLIAAHAALLLRAPLRYFTALRFCLRLRDRNRLRAFAQAGWLTRRLARLEIAHLHVHFASEPASVAELVNLLGGVSYSVSAHAKDVYLSSRASLRRKLRRARFVVTCTEYNRSRLARIAGSRTAVLRMYHGVDLARFQRRTGPLNGAGPPLLLAVGRLREKKGFAVLVEACRLLRESGVELRCEIVGYGEERERLESLIAHHGLADRVRLAGKMTHEQLIGLYARASVFALPCRIASDGDRDGIPNALLEALAMELAVVSTQVSGVPEVIEDGVNGLLVRPGDAAGLAQAIGRLLADPALRARLGAAGRRTVAERFSNDVNLCTVSDRLMSAVQGAGASVPARAARVAMTAEVAYILKGYPRLSETFIANEIHLLESMGLKLRLYSLLPGDKGPAHGVITRIHAQPRYLPPMTSLSGTSFPRWLWHNLPPFLAAHARLVRRRPRQYLATLGAMLAMAWRYRSTPLSAPRKVFFKEFLQAGAIALQVIEDRSVRHLHGHYCHGATTVTWFTARLTGLPFSFTAHARDIYKADLNPGDLLRRKMQAARFVVTCTGANRAHLARVCPRHPALHTVYHGLDTGFFAPRSPAAAGPPLILAVGRFVQKKGFDFLVAACAQLKAAGVQVRCTIVGPAGPHSERIRALIEELDVADAVTLHGGVTQEHLLELYARATLFVLPCLRLEDGDQDGIPNVLAEAMASGVPVVSTAISGIPELIEHGTHGLLVPERDSRALAAAVAELLGSPALRQRLAEAARRRICTVFDSRHTTRGLYRLFAESIGAEAIVPGEGSAAPVAAVPEVVG